MPNADDLAVLKQGASSWNTWRQQDPSTQPDLRDADLRRTDLEGFNLSGADLTGADLRSTKVSGADLTDAILRDTDLEGVDLSATDSGIKPEQLAGADLTGAKLPDPLEKLFEDLDAAKGISENAQKLFVVMLAACLYSWLTIATTTDVNLVTDRAASPLPIIQTSIPIVSFYVVTPLLLLGLYLYFHFYLQKLWEELATLPAIFQDGRPLYAKADPWLLSDLVRSHLSKLSYDRPFMSYLQKWISILLAWWVVPITEVLFWARYIRRHDLTVTAFHTVVVAVSITAAFCLYHLASATLRGRTRRPFTWRSALTSGNAYGTTVLALMLCAVFVALSISTINGIRSGSSDDNWWPQAQGWHTWVPRAMAFVGYTPFADLKEADISTKPSTWTGSEDADHLTGVKGLQLNRVDLRYGDLRGAFLATTVLADADLEYADLLGADLRRSKCAGAHLTGALLQDAQLDQAVLWDADLSGSDLTGASLAGAKLKYATLTSVRGLDPERVKQADDWKMALYDDATLKALGLPPYNNDYIESKRAAEPFLAESEDIANRSREEQFARTSTAQIIGHGKPMPVVKPRGSEDVLGTTRTAREIARLYDFPLNLDGLGQRIAILEFDGGYKDSDLRTYFDRLKLPLPKVSSVSIDGKQNQPGGASDGQVELDIEIVGAVAPKADIVIYFAPFTSQGWVDALTAVMNDKNRPSVLTIGWGYGEGMCVSGQAPECAFSLQAMNAVNQALKLTTAAGVTICAAAENEQATDHGATHVDFPASSPWVLAVGGSSLVSSGNSIVSEAVWTNDVIGSPIGGVSDIFPLPDWQAEASVPAGKDGQRHRSVPDVVANASPFDGYLIFTDDHWTPIGGTSASTPLWAGLIALVNQGTGRNAGYLNPILYDLMRSYPVLRSVPNGNQDKGAGAPKEFGDKPAWNSSTGWGSPDGVKLLAALRFYYTHGRRDDTP